MLFLFSIVQVFCPCFSTRSACLDGRHCQSGFDTKCKYTFTPKSLFICLLFANPNSIHLSQEHLEERMEEEELSGGGGGGGGRFSGRGEDGS